MTEVDISLSCHIVGELFGPVCSKVCYYLMKEGELTFALLRKHTTFSPEELRRALVILLHNRVISVYPGKVTCYNCNLQSVLVFCFYKYYIALVKKLYGDICELVVEELLFMGQMTYMQCVERTVKRYNDVVEPEEALSMDRVKEKFTVLLREGIIVQVIGNNCEGIIEQQSASEANGQKRSKSSHEDATSIETIFEQTTRRKRFRRDGRGLDNNNNNSLLDDGGLKRLRVEDPDIGLYYGAGHNLLARLFAEDYLIRLASEYFDAVAGRVLAALFRLARRKLVKLSLPQPGWGGIPAFTGFIDDPSDSQMIFTPHDVIREVNSRSASSVQNPTSEIALATVQQYLSLLCGKFSDIKFIVKASENSYSCDMQRAFKGIALRSIENVIEHRYGIKCLRIFRMIQANDCCDQKLMEQTVLMPVKECRERLYNLITNGFVVVREGVSSSGVGGSTPAAGGTRFGTGRSGTAAAYTIEMDRVNRMLLSWTKKAILNCMNRREFEVISNKRVIDREKRVMDLLEAMQQEGSEYTDEDRAALEEMLPPAERQIAASVRKSVFKLENAECQLMESLFVFELAVRLYKNHHF